MDKKFKEFLSMQNPYILEERDMHVTQMDVFSRLMMDRIIYIASPIDDTVASIVTAQLLFLESVDPGRDITLQIMSPGGSCSAGMGIIDTIGIIKPDVRTVNIGMCASMGCTIFAAGKKGKRQALPNSKFLIHQPLISGGGISGPTDDILIEAEEMKKLKKDIFEFLSLRTGQPYEKITKDATRDFWLTAEEAKEYGLVDEVIKIDWSKK